MFFEPAPSAAVPVASASTMDWNERAIAPGVLVVNSAFTVSEIMPISAAASRRPSTMPRAEPMIPSIEASPRKTSTAKTQLRQRK